MSISRNTIPIVFSFNDGYILPALVSISSLLRNARDNTFYEIFVLFSNTRLNIQNREKVIDLQNRYDNFEISFIDVKDAFKDVDESRYITIDAYYRLLIPELIPEYEKIIYADVDIIFLGDLAELYQVDLTNNYLAGVPIIKGAIDASHFEKLGVKESGYINSGVLLLNNMKLRENKMVDLFKKQVLEDSYFFYDQDVINIVCQGKIIFLDGKYNLSNSRIASYVENKDWNGFQEVLRSAVVIHYTGDKPWNVPVLMFEIWWEYYRKLEAFNAKYYFDFQMKYTTNIHRALRVDKYIEDKGVYRVLKFIRSVYRKIKS